MCKYSKELKGECVNQKAGMHKVMMVAALHRHNELRAKVARGEVPGQPSASNMMKLKWNSEMATIAQRWANQCIDGHDKCRGTEDGKSVGQNAAMNFVKTSDTEEDKDKEAAIKSVDAWFSEVSDTEAAQIDTFTGASSKGKTIGHYTQLVWATTTDVGCGYVEMKRTNDVFQQFRIKCNYKPAGNMMSLPIYKKGTPCSECPSGTTCSNKYNGLCTDNDEDDGIKEVSGAFNCRELAVSMVITALVLHWFVFNIFL